MLGIGVIVVGVLLVSVVSYREIKKAGGVTWIEILVYPFLLLICALLEHIDLPGFLIFLGLVCIVFGSCMVMASIFYNIKSKASSSDAFLFYFVIFIFNVYHTSYPDIQGSKCW
ncbi:hypothetical protein ICK_03052 [Bacillus cereus BAG1X2-2]|nr:hypothetical protein ICK_03052 [Bacillus cereus BAG1X2-2]